MTSFQMVDICGPSVRAAQSACALNSRWQLSGFGQWVTDEGYDEGSRSGILWPDGEVLSAAFSKKIIMAARCCCFRVLAFWRYNPARLTDMLFHAWARLV